MMTDESDFLTEQRAKVAAQSGEITALRAQLAAVEAAEERYRTDLEATRTAAALAEAALGHHQRAEAERTAAANRMMTELEERLEEAVRRQDQAERERSALIAALGRRARRHLNPAD